LGDHTPLTLLGRTVRDPKTLLRSP